MSEEWRKAFEAAVAESGVYSGNTETSARSMEDPYIIREHSMDPEPTRKQRTQTHSGRTWKVPEFSSSTVCSSD